MFLLVAAGLKVHGLTIDPLSQDSFLASPRLQVATIEVEILLGLWLVSGWSIRAVHVTAFVFFGILAGVSLYLALIGQRSCGCFGKVAVNPWLALTFDIAVVAALLIWRPRRVVPVSTVWLPELLKTVAVAVLFLVLIGGVFWLISDNPAEALTRLRGESITVAPALSDMGDGVAGEWRNFTILLTNHGSRPVRVVGGTSSCVCMATDDLPAIIPPGASHSLLIRMRFQGSAGSFQHRFTFQTDDENHPTVVARFSGHVSPKAEVAIGSKP